LAARKRITISDAPSHQQAAPLSPVPA
jgi:hypothetical protein